MPGHPLAAIWKLDPELKDYMARAEEFTYADGALSRKNKLLIAMALDAAIGKERGVTSLARQAQAAGASEGEITEALRVTYHLTGVQSVYTASAGLEETAGQ
jgi:alkylhydroperoxidase/carboxymuconolactone decarboxylase family protein YurZ